MGYSLVPGIANHLRPRSRRDEGFAGISNAGLVAGAGILGAAVGGVIEGLFVYVVTRHVAGVESAKARKAALWAGGIVFGLSTVFSLAGFGVVDAADAVAPTYVQQLDPTVIIE